MLKRTQGSYILNRQGDAKGKLGVVATFLFALSIVQSASASASAVTRHTTGIQKSDDSKIPKWSIQRPPVNSEYGVISQQANGLTLLQGKLLISPKAEKIEVKTAFGDIETGRSYVEIERVERGVEVYVFKGQARVKSLDGRNSIVIESGTKITLKTTGKDGGYLAGLPRPIVVKDKVKSLVLLSQNQDEFLTLMKSCSHSSLLVSQALAKSQQAYFEGIRADLARRAEERQRVQREIASEKQSIRKLYEQKNHQSEE